MTFTEVSVVLTFVNSVRQTLAFQNFWKDLCAVVGAPLLVLRHRHHLEGCSAETAGSHPHREERGRRAWGLYDPQRSLEELGKLKLKIY